MPIPVFSTDANDNGRQAAADAAAIALRSGRLVVIPTETVYGLAGAISLPGSVEHLTVLGGIPVRTAAPAGPQAPPPRPAAWHAPAVAAVEANLNPAFPLHRRALRRLAPGPVTFLVEREAAELARLVERIGALPRTIDNGRELAVRVPDHSVARDILQLAGIPIAAVRLSEGGWRTARDVAESLSRLDSAASRVALIVDDGPTRLGKPSTTVRLRLDGGVEVVAAGAIEERQVRRRLERHILFVCSGNTCRSPMAEAIARHLVEHGAAGGPGAVPTRIRSAGTSADGGAPTPDAIDAVRAMGIEPGRDFTHRRARTLDREATGEADVIFAMTGSHVRAIAALDPSAAGKIHTIDPSGLDVPDPIGGTPAVYLSTAERLKHLIERRLQELDERGA